MGEGAGGLLLDLVVRFDPSDAGVFGGANIFLGFVGHVWRTYLPRGTLTKPGSFKTFLAKGSTST